MNMKRNQFSASYILIIVFFLLSMVLFKNFALHPLFTQKKTYSSKVTIESKYENKHSNLHKMDQKKTDNQKNINPFSKIASQKILYNWKNLRGIPVLCYHKIPKEKKTSSYDVPLAQFREQMQWLSHNGYRTISLNKFHQIMLGREKMPDYKPFLITFDDGLRDFLTAEKVMDQYNFKGVLFIYPTYIMSKRKIVLTWNELKAIEKRGHEIESHTYWHPLLNTMTAKEQKKQLVLSQKKIEQYIADNVQYLAYPFGIYDNQTLYELPLSGYLGAFTIYEGENLPGQNPYLAKRYMVVHSDSLKRFASKIQRKTLPIEKVQPIPGSFIHNLSTITIQLPPNLNSNDLRILISGKNTRFHWSYKKNGKLTLYQFSNLHKYITITIHYREKNTLWQNKLLYNIQSKKNLAKKN